MQGVNWNEANTFSKLTCEMLENLGYPSRASELCDEETFVEKLGGGSGRYDVAYKADGGVLLLVEMKKKGKPLGQEVERQALDYLFGPTFDPLPPPFLLISNGDNHLWYKRIRQRDKSYKYSRCKEIPWRTALNEQASGNLTQELTLAEVVRLLQRIRTLIFHDLESTYFPRGFQFKACNLRQRRVAFEKILTTRKSFVDPSLDGAGEKREIESVVSSIALSITLKILFVKIKADLDGKKLPFSLKQAIDRLSGKFPGILKAEPYDVLEVSSNCDQQIYEMICDVRTTEALVFSAKKNPIGVIYDGLVKSEEHDIQVKSLGNVYTPPELVEAMVVKAGKALENWLDVRVVEPSCGSGHFVREIYDVMLSAYTRKYKGRLATTAIHKKILDNLLAIDIDPFAVQTTQLGIFLELNIFPEVWQKISKNGPFDFKKIVKCADYLDGKVAKEIKQYGPNLIIGNPPYGVSVTDSLKKRFELGSADSYGLFIKKALADLVEDGHLVLVVSSTFLTNSSHTALRKGILESSRVESVYLLHRRAFPRDVFCCLIHFKKAKKLNARESMHTYRFYDAWSIAPGNPEYQNGLSAWSANQDVSGSLKRNIVAYRTPSRHIFNRLFPPSTGTVRDAVDSLGLPEFLSESRSLHSRKIKRGKKGRIETEVGVDEAFPISPGLPSLGKFCFDRPNEDFSVTEHIAEFAALGNISCLRFGEKSPVDVVKLWQICHALQGLATADDEHFLRKTKGVVPNARRKYVKDVVNRNTVPQSGLKRITDKQKAQGIAVSDPQRNRFFVPFDTGGESDTENGELRVFFSEVDYWIDWSQSAVSLLKKRDKLASGTPRKPRLNNFSHYFKRGIVGTITGLYAPTFYMSFGGVFGQKANLLLPFNEELTDYLLVVLSSSMTRYFAKNFISLSVDFSTDNFRHLPIPIPRDADLKKATRLVNRIRKLKRKNKNLPFKQIAKIIDPFVFRLFGLKKEDRKEVNEWFSRHYYLLGNPSQKRRKTNQSSRRGLRKVG